MGSTSVGLDRPSTRALAQQVQSKQSKSRYNPNRIRRRAHLVEVDAAQIAHLRIYSLTRQNKEVLHRMEVDLQSTQCMCNCEDFRFRCSKHTVTVSNAATRGCKHIPIQK